MELHCAHGGANLHASFLSPYYNRRTDQYGGSWENRLRFIVETIEAIRKVVGRDYPLFVRFSADELLGERGITLDASVKYIVPALEKAGVDAIDVSQGSVLHSMEGISIPLYYPRGCFIENAAAIKKATSLPVIGVGRILDLDMAEQFLEQGKADVIYLASQLGADPETPKKYFEGRPDETRKCIGCKPVLCSTPCTINYDSEVGSNPADPCGNQEEGPRHRRRRGRHGSGKDRRTTGPQRHTHGEGVGTGRHRVRPVPDETDRVSSRTSSPIWEPR